MSIDDLRRRLRVEADTVAIAPLEEARADVVKRVRRQRALRIAVVAPFVAVVLVAALSLMSTAPADDTEVASDTDRTTTTAAAKLPATDCPSSIGLCGPSSTGDSTTTTWCPEGSADPAGPCTTTSVPGTDTTTGPSTTTPDSEPDPTTGSTATTSDTTPDPAAPLNCGTLSPIGWPTTFAQLPDVSACFAAAFEGGKPAHLTWVIYDPDPEHRHVKTFETQGAGLPFRVTDDWSSATAGPVGTITVDLCRSFTISGGIYPVAGDCERVSG